MAKLIRPIDSDFVEEEQIVYGVTDDAGDSIILSAGDVDLGLVLLVFQGEKNEYEYADSSRAGSVMLTPKEARKLGTKLIGLARLAEENE